MLSLHIFLFIQTLFQLTPRAMQMVIIYAVAEAVTPVVNGIGSKVIGVIDTSLCSDEGKKASVKLDEIVIYCER